MELLFSRSIYGENISRQECKAKAVLVHLLQGSRKLRETSAILSVRGSMTFNAQLVAAVPDFATLTRVSRELREFRSKPRFDLLFYSCPQDADDKRASFLEDICYCRMLLRPGAYLFLAREANSSGNIIGQFFDRNDMEASWLRRAGFMNISTQNMGTGEIFWGGQRPLQNF